MVCDGRGDGVGLSVEVCDLFDAYAWIVRFEWPITRIGFNSRYADEFRPSFEVCVTRKVGDV